MLLTFCQCVVWKFIGPCDLDLLCSCREIRMSVTHATGNFPDKFEASVNFWIREWHGKLSPIPSLWIFSIYIIPVDISSSPSHNFTPSQKIFSSPSSSCNPVYRHSILVEGCCMGLHTTWYNLTAGKTIAVTQWVFNPVAIVELTHNVHCPVHCSIYCKTVNNSNITSTSFAAVLLLWYYHEFFPIPVVLLPLYNLHGNTAKFFCYHGNYHGWYSIAEFPITVSLYSELMGLNRTSVDRQLCSVMRP